MATLRVYPAGALRSLPASARAAGAATRANIPRSARTSSGFSADIDDLPSDLVSVYRTVPGVAAPPGARGGAVVLQPEAAQLARVAEAARGGDALDRAIGIAQEVARDPEADAGRERLERDAGRLPEDTRQVAAAHRRDPRQGVERRARVGVRDQPVLHPVHPLVEMRAVFEKDT